MTKYRIAENEWNLKGSPWRDAIGIEEIDDGMAVPPLICWFTRGSDTHALTQRVVDLLNAEAPPSNDLMTLHDRVMDRFNADGSIVDRDVLALLSMLCKRDR
jgi:hypothetical protein